VGGASFAQCLPFSTFLRIFVEEAVCARDKNDASLQKLSVCLCLPAHECASGVRVVAKICAASCCRFWRFRRRRHSLPAFFPFWAEGTSDTHGLSTERGQDGSPSRLPSSHLFFPHSRIPLLTAQHNTPGVNHHGAAAGGNRASTARQQQRRREQQQQQQQQCQRQNKGVCVAVPATCKGGGEGASEGRREGGEAHQGNVFSQHPLPPIITAPATTTTTASSTTSTTRAVQCHQGRKLPKPEAALSAAAESRRPRRNVRQDGRKGGQGRKGGKEKEGGRRGRQAGKVTKRWLPSSRLC